MNIVNTLSKRSVIIVAGGIGKRMKSETPKQFIVVCGKPVLAHTLEQFYNFDASMQIVLVLPEQHIDYWKNLCVDHKITIPHEIVIGGSERFFSVKNGLQKIKNAEWVAIHDGVRPLINKKLIQRCFNEVKISRAVIPAINPTETVRYGTKKQTKLLDRDNLFLVQTPQVFDILMLRQAYEVDYNERFTDDASVVENMGYPLSIVEGDKQNIKITHAFDIEYFKYIIQRGDDFCNN